MGSAHISSGEGEIDFNTHAERIAGTNELLIDGYLYLFLATFRSNVPCFDKSIIHFRKFILISPSPKVPYRVNSGTYFEL
jgi:hypothetical protein